MTRQDQVSAAAVNSRIGNKIRILLADDHTRLRKCICRLLQREADLDIVGEAENGRQAIDLARQCSPRVVIMDVDMPVMNGIEATRILTREMPWVKVVALSMYLETDASAGIREAGAAAYLTKGCSMEELVTTIRSAAQILPRVFEFERDKTSRWPTMSK
jgi:DNA-binding NarL/FixJ family response regulator